MSRHVRSDWPADRPPTATHFCAQMERTGCVPSGWLDTWAQSKEIANSDHVYYELRTIIDSLEFAGCHDQLSLGSVVNAELLCLQVQTVVDAYDANPNKPSFENAKYLSGLTSLTDVVWPDLKNSAARRAKEETEVEEQRQEVRKLRDKGDSNRTDAAGWRR
eukprot:727937-Pyramimonas_sp.AAC.1